MEADNDSKLDLPTVLLVGIFFCGLVLGFGLACGNANAGNFNHGLNRGDTFTIRCQNGTLSQPSHTGSAWTLTCAASGTPPTQPPPVTTPPPSGDCSGRKLLPHTVRPFQYGKDTRGFLIDPGRSVSTPFTAADLRNRRLSVVTGGHSVAGQSQPAPSNTMTVSKCPGDFGLDLRQKGCYSGSAESSINVVGGFNSVGACRIDGGQYWINTTAGNAASGTSACSGSCGAIQSIK